MTASLTPEKMARWTTAKVLWLLNVVHQTLALSAHSPRDLEAFPSYSVILSQNPVLNETAIEILAEEATVRVSLQGGSTRSTASR